MTTSATDGTPADPQTLTSVERKWRPGDRTPPGPRRALQVVAKRVTDENETPVLIVQDVSG